MPRCAPTGWGSPNVPADRGLVAFLAALVAGLDADGQAAARVRRLAGSRAAVVGLDDEWASVRFGADGTLHVASADGPSVPWGRSDRGTVVDVLRARAEVRDVVLSGRVEVVGGVEEVAAMFAIVEVLLAASARLPALQALADELVAPAAPEQDAPTWYPDEITSAERDLLQRLDLLSDDVPGVPAG